MSEQGQPSPSNGLRPTTVAVAALAIAVAGIGIAAIAFRGDFLDGTLLPPASEGSPGTPSQTTTYSPEPAKSCTGRTEPAKLAETEVGQWFLRLLFEVGAPEGWPVAPEHVSDRYREFFVDIPQHVGRFDMYMWAEPPDRVNFPHGIESPVLARSGDFVLQGKRFDQGFGRYFQQFSVIHPRVWISVHINPTRAGQEMDREAMVEWFHRLVAAAEASPPPPCLERFASS